jgi:hypothetical protein
MDNKNRKKIKNISQTFLGNKIMVKVYGFAQFRRIVRTSGRLLLTWK